MDRWQRQIERWTWALLNAVLTTITTSGAKIGSVIPFRDRRNEIGRLACCRTEGFDARSCTPLLEDLSRLVGAHRFSELTVVGERSAQVPERHLGDRRIRWIGAVSRSEVMSHYRAADALIFPSLSDGFGMAQIEARGWRLPIVASRSCGQVVADGVNGLLLAEVTPEAIAAAIARLLAEPQLLAKFSHNSTAAPGGGLDALGEALSSLEDAG